MKRRDADSPNRNCMDVGPGDFIKIGDRWERVASNTAYGLDRDGPPPREGWTVTTEDGQTHTMFGINRYAKAEDFANG